MLYETTDEPKTYFAVQIISTRFFKILCMFYRKPFVEYMF